MRYSRQERVIGRRGQDSLKKSRVIVVGVGALGCVSAQLLVRAGVGSVVVVDRDVVELDNLQRQVLYSEENVGLPKAGVAERVLRGMNSDVEVEGRCVDLSSVNVDLLEGFDLVVDCTDSMETRFLLNDYCRKNSVAWIYAGGIRDEGSVWFIDGSRGCFSCVFDRVEGLETCDRVGVLNSLTTVVGGLQAHLALCHLSGRKVEKRMVRVGLSSLDVECLDVQEKEECDCCNGRYGFLEGKEKNVVKACGKDLFFMSGLDLDLARLKNEIKCENLGGCLRSKDFYLFATHALIRAKNVAEAKKIFCKEVGL
ncbi:thiamine biosynthesis protein ThiF [Candidatus Woesearchaeota archaeon]|nr:thiamine biosynthesis protein ThiF [Candidatus Woesearchaeota archaeon]